ncbi:MAG: ion transporter [Methanobrevibacter sp.]|nr:ion transporter [Methanobrevibacter sp.]
MVDKKKFVNVTKIILSLIIIVDVILITFSLVFDVSVNIYNKILLFDIMTCVVLLFDFFYGLFKADDRKQYFKENWIELIASIPFDIILSPFMILRYLRLIKIFRVLFLISEYFELIGRFLKNTHLDEILAVFLLIVIGSTLSLYLVDPGMNNLFDDLWFVVVSLTTVGYGDITPNTVYGKIVSLILLIVGVFIFSAITGAISTYFMDNLLEEGSFRIIQLTEKVDDLTSQLEKNNQKIDDLTDEIAELKEIIRKNNDE